MSNRLDYQYLDVLQRILSGEKYPNRTGTDTYKTTSKMIQHDMSEGFPLLTTKKVAWKTMKVELEGFIKGITSKKWYQERGCHIWDEWCNPQKVPYSTDPEVQKQMAEEDDLGPCIYGASWRNFHNPWEIRNNHQQAIDQLENVVYTLKNNPQDRRMLCVAWNPLGLHHTALPPCHVLFQVMTRGNKVDLNWYQRSCDWFLGVPFNIASYGLLLHLLAKEAGMEEGVLTGMFGDVHLYENHVDQAKEQLSRSPYDLPTVETPDFPGIFEWEYGHTKLINYKSHSSIKAPVAV